MLEYSGPVKKPQSPVGSTVADRPSDPQTRQASPTNTFGITEQSSPTYRPGQRVQQIPNLPPASFGQVDATAGVEIAQFAGWVPNEESGTQRWDELLQGVRWYSDAEGNAIWFEIESRGEVPRESLEGFERMAGRENARTWNEWSNMNWSKWAPYIGETLGASAEADESANVRKNPDFDAEAVPEAARAVASKYFHTFKIIDRGEFNDKIQEIAVSLCKLGERTAYSCIVSEAGKSNYWVTAKVLDVVQRMGGAPPRRIISAPAKEKGEKSALERLSIDLEGAGDLVFLDDGSYSGAQLQKFITKIKSQKGAGTAHVGLVAASERALRGVHGLLPSEPHEQPLLAEPYKIDEAPAEALDQLYKGLDIGLATQDVNPDGNYSTGFYYKIPDYASVRTKFLTPGPYSKQKNNPPILGYKESSLDIKEFQRSGKQRVTGGTEPYKSITALAPNIESALASGPAQVDDSVSSSSLAPRGLGGPSSRGAKGLGGPSSLSSRGLGGPSSLGPRSIGGPSSRVPFGSEAFPVSEARPSISLRGKSAATSSRGFSITRKPTQVLPTEEEPKKPADTTPLEKKGKEDDEGF